VLSTSKVVFVLASVTSANQGFLGERQLGLLQDGAVFLLMSRAAVSAAIGYPPATARSSASRITATGAAFPVHNSNPMAAW